MKIIPKDWENEYDAVINVIDDWCSHNHYTSFVVRLKNNGVEENVYLDCCDAVLGFDYDWYEGGEVELLGFMPIEDVEIPEKYRC